MSSSKKRRRKHREKSSLTIWDHILQKWTVQMELGVEYGLEPLCNRKRQPESRFIMMENTLVSVTKMNVEGINSETFLVRNYTTKEEGILKHFQPKGRDDIGPFFEAELQKYAHCYGLAPAVFASNHVGMISEKCQPLVFVPEQKCYKNVKELSVQLRTRANMLQTMFTSSSTQILECCKKMYSKIGLFNLDPNDGNYMQLEDRIVQIDYGANRFHNMDDFEKFFAQLDEDVPKKSAIELLLNATACYPPTYYWYKYLCSPFKELSREKQLYNESSWSIFVEQLRVERQEVCKTLQNAFEILLRQKQAKSAETITNEMRAYFYMYVLGDKR